MRPSFALLAAALILSSACSSGGPAAESEEAAPQGPDREAGEHALVSVAYAADGACTLRWDGQPVAPGAFEARAMRALEQLVEQAGGPQNISAMGLSTLPPSERALKRRSASARVSGWRQM